MSADAAGNGRAAGAPTDGDGGDGEEIICRFCLEAGRVVSVPSSRDALVHGLRDLGDDVLVAPCRCEGSQRFVHLACLRHWQHTLVTDRVPMAERGGIARMLARLISPGRGADERHTTDADCYGDARSAVCQVCTTPFRIPPPTRYAMLREKVGADGAVLVRGGGMLVKTPDASEAVARAVERQMRAAATVDDSAAEQPAEMGAEESSSAPEAAASPPAAAPPALTPNAGGVGNASQHNADAGTSGDAPPEGTPMISVYVPSPASPAHVDVVGNGVPEPAPSSEDGGNDDNASDGDAPARPRERELQQTIADVLRVLLHRRHGHWTKSVYLILDVALDDDAVHEFGEEALEAASREPTSLEEYARCERLNAELALKTRVVGVNLCRYDGAGPVVRIHRRGTTAERDEDVVARLRIRKFTGGPVAPDTSIGICWVARSILDGSGRVDGVPWTQAITASDAAELSLAGATAADSAAHVCLWGKLAGLCAFLKDILDERDEYTEIVVNAYSGTAVWNKTQLLGEVARGDWGLGRALAEDLRVTVALEAASQTPWVKLMADETRKATVHWPPSPSPDGA